MIGTGVGAASGVAMLATIGAGTGVLGSELGYQATAGKDFSSAELLETSAVGGVTGAVTGVLRQPGLNPVVSVGGKLLVQGVSGVADYSLRSAIKGDSISAEGVGVSFGVGVGADALNEVIPTATRMIMGAKGYRFYSGRLEDSFVEAFRRPDNEVRQVMRSQFARTQVWQGIDDVVRSGAITTITNPMQAQ